MEAAAPAAAAPAARCQSCGGPCVDGDLCNSCKQAFASVLGNSTVTKASDDTAAGSLQKPPIVEQKAPVVEQKAPIVVKTTAAVAPPVASANAIQLEVSRSDTAKAVADLTAKAHLAKAANPAPVPKRPIVAASPQRRSRTTMWIKAAALIVVAIGAVEGARRVGFQWPQQIAPEGAPAQPSPVVEPGKAAVRTAPPADASPVAAVVTENRTTPVASPNAVASPKPAAPAARRRPARQENSSNQQAAPVVAASPVAETPAPVAARQPVAVAAEPAPPTGRFFERNDVDQPPQIATRVEPQLPANLPARANNAVVVVRLLVSRTGHPFRVSLLRGSMLGRSADEAVVAAVTQWTFSPATKRGEPVNCWYNIGVPLGQAN